MRGLFLHGVYAWPRVNGRSFLDTRVHDSCNKDPRGIS